MSVHEASLEAPPRSSRRGPSIRYEDGSARSPRFYDRWVLPLMNDERDLVFVDLGLQCLVLAAFGIALFFVDAAFWYLAPVYTLAWMGLLMDRFILMLHCTSHRPLFKPKHRWLNNIIPWLLSPFFGETPETYFVHHMGMHHREENLPADLSSTMKYQRDRLWHWLRYWSRFLFGGPFELGAYLKKRRRDKLFRRMVVGEGGFWLAAVGLCCVNWQAAVVVFIFPVLLVRALMMMGNWGQHAFVCPEQPENPYRSSITCINTRYNRRCFNDGYHIHHHVNARTHWTELPAEFESHRELYGTQDAIVFDGIDFFQVWLFLMLGRFNWLADHWVPLPGAPKRTREEFIELMKVRLRPFPADRLAALKAAAGG